MGTADPRRVIMGLDGALCHTPTDIATTAFPHGGTAIGMVRDMQFRYGEKHALIQAEEFGQVVVEGFRWQDSPVLVAVLRDWDDAALATIYPDTTTGDSGRTVITGGVSTNKKRGGQLLSSLAVSIAFSPTSVDQQPFVMIYKAIPVAMETVMDLRLDQEVGLAVAFYGIPDSTGRLFQVATRGDVTL